MRNLLVGELFVVAHQDHFAVGLVEPFTVIVGTAKSFTRIVAGKEKPEVSGPVAIVTHASTLPGFGAGARLAGALGAYALPLVVLLSLALALIRPGRRHPP